jgi:hypothetical protein
MQHSNEAFSVQCQGKKLGLAQSEALRQPAVWSGGRRSRLSFGLSSSVRAQGIWALMRSSTY